MYLQRCGWKPFNIICINWKILQRCMNYSDENDFDLSVISTPKWLPIALIMTLPKKMRRRDENPTLGEGRFFILFDANIDWWCPDSFKKSREREAEGTLAFSSLLSDEVNLDKEFARIAKLLFWFRDHFYENMKIGWISDDFEPFQESIFISVKKEFDSLMLWNSRSCVLSVTWRWKPSNDGFWIRVGVLLTKTQREKLIKISSFLCRDSYCLIESFQQSFYKCLKSLENVVIYEVIEPRFPKLT